MQCVARPNQQPRMSARAHVLKSDGAGCMTPPAFFSAVCLSSLQYFISRLSVKNHWNSHHLKNTRSKACFVPHGGTSGRRDDAYWKLQLSFLSCTRVWLMSDWCNLITTNQKQTQIINAMRLWFIKKLIRSYIRTVWYNSSNFFIYNDTLIEQSKRPSTDKCTSTNLSVFQKVLTNQTPFW